MIDILPKQRGAASGFLTDVQPGLSGLLNSLAQQRASEMQVNRLAPGLSQILGIPMEQARSLAYQPESILGQLVKQQYQTQAGQQELDTLRSLLGGSQEQPVATQGQIAQQPTQSPGQPQMQPPRTGLNSTSPIAPTQQTTAPQLPTTGFIKPGSAVRYAQLLESRKAGEENRALKKELVDIKHQQLIDSRNAPYLKKLDADIGPAESLNAKARKLKALLTTGNVSGGVFGGLTPTRLQNTETQQFDSGAKELATELAGTGKGVATNYKIKMAQEAKALLNHLPKTQEELVNDVIEKTDKVIKADHARQEVIEQNHGNQPPNIKFAVAQKLKEPKYIYDLPLGDRYEDGGEISEGDILKAGGKEFERVQGDWQEIK